MKFIIERLPIKLKEGQASAQSGKANKCQKCLFYMAETFKLLTYTILIIGHVKIWHSLATILKGGDQ